MVSCGFYRVLIKKILKDPRRVLYFIEICKYSLDSIRIYLLKFIKIFLRRISKYTDGIINVLRNNTL